MPRGGSPTLPPGTVPAEPMSIGEVADPPFAVLPDPALVFARRAARFADLATTGNELAGYLRFATAVTQAQADTLPGLPAAELPSGDRIETALAHAMPPISIGQITLGETADVTLTTFLSKLSLDGAPDVAKTAVKTIGALGRDHRLSLMDAVFRDEPATDQIAPHMLAACALQVHMTRLAAQLDASRLTRIADGACPACGAEPVASAIVGWEGAYGTRFCTCSLCATQWHVPRIRCLVCSEEKSVAYHRLENGPETIMGETCAACSSYVKMFHQHKDTKLDPVADDVGSLGLDIVLGREGYQRRSSNPLLMGY